MSTAMDFLSTHAPIVAISLAIVLATFVIINSRAKKTSDGKKKKYHPFVTNYLKTLVNFSRLHHYMTEMAHKNRSYQAFNFFIDYVITQDPANIEYILKTNFANYGKGWYHNGVLSDVLGDGIFAVDGEKWLHQRKVSSNELATKVAKQFSNTVYKDSAVKLARKISEASTSEKAMEIQDLFMKATLDSIVRILLGIELDTVNGTNEEGTKFAHAFDVANAMTIYRYVDFTWKIRRFLNIGSEAVLKKTMVTVDKFVYSLINSKIETVKNSPEAVKKGDMISGLLDLRDSTTGNPKYLRDMILCLIAAGRDTTASTLTWFVYFMGKYPHIQEKVAQEVKKVLNPKENSSFEELAESITEESLEKMQYLHACLTETLRLYPSVPINAKVCLSDDTWPDGFNVKKGNFVGYNAYSMGRMKYLWGDDAEEFRPERWLNENGIFQPESPFKFTAFNAGPRICLGRDHAYRQTKTICAVLVNSFRFKTSDVHKEEPRYMTMISLHVDGGLFVHVSPRSGR